MTVIRHRFYRPPTEDASIPEQVAIPPISYTPMRAAEVTDRSRTRIFKAIKDKELMARKDGRATLIEHAELVRWVQSMPVK